jgi:hypothetical protein
VPNKIYDIRRVFKMIGVKKVYKIKDRIQEDQKIDADKI